MFVLFSSLHQVTVLQRARNPGKEETFPFILDESLKNITIYITGTDITFTLTNPAGSTLFQMQWKCLRLVVWRRLLLLRMSSWCIFKSNGACYQIPGVSQNSIEASGKLGTIQTVGNLRRIRLNADKQMGTWKIHIKSSKPYTLKITGQKWMKLYPHLYTLNLEAKGTVHVLICFLAENKMGYIWQIWWQPC